MSTNLIKIPVLIRDHKIGAKVYFALRPIFVPLMTVIESRFEQGVERLKKNYLQLLGEAIHDKKHLNEVLLALYHPLFSYKQIPVEFKLENIQVSGKFSIVIFEEAGYTFVQLPFVNGYVFIARNSIKQKAKFAKELSAVLHVLLKELKLSDADFAIENYYATNKEFIHYLELPNIFQAGAFPKQDEGRFAVFGTEQKEEFDALTELYKVGVNYSEKYPNRLKRAFFQEEVVMRLVDLIFYSSQSPIVLLGEHGIGKHTIISEVIFQYLSKSKSENDKTALRDVWKLDPIRLIAGMSYVGSWQRRLNVITSFLRKPKNDHNLSDVLLIDNPVALLNIGKSAKNDMAIKDVLKPLLEKKSLPIVLLATPEEWKIIQEKDRSFSTLFQIIRLKEPGEQKAIGILLKKRASLESEYNMTFTIHAIGKLVDLYRSYQKNEALPGSLIRHLERVAAKSSGQIVDVSDIVHEFSEASGLSDSIVGWNAQSDSRDLSLFFERRIIGQPAAIESLVNVTNLIKAKLTVANKPYSSFLFVGPTGVGKTQAAKALAEYIMGSEKELIRFDMNEFIDYYAVERLIGSAYKTEGLLTEKLRHHPYGVILFDEIEKAHPAVLDIMLQILDEGQLTDGAGRRIDFSRVVILMTSNVGASSIGTHVGYGSNNENATAIYLKAIRDRFRPEWINRIDEIITFQPLQRKHLVQIAHLQIKELLHREGLIRRMTILNIAPDVLKWIADKGYNPKMGGRALKRQIENDLTKLTADYLISITDESPLIFSIILDEDVLVPKIKRLNFPETKGIDFLPEIPLFENGGAAYATLLRRIAKIEKLISENAPVSHEAINTNLAAVNWAYYDFQTKVTDLKMELRVIKNGFNDNHFFQKRRSVRSRYTDWQTASSHNVIDRLQEKLNHTFYKAKPLFDTFATEYLQYLINVRLLEIQAEHFEMNNWQEVELKFSSLVHNRGHAYLSFVFEKYTALFSKLKILKSMDDRKKSMKVEGYGVYELVKHEYAIHLFLTKHGASIPIRVEVSRTNENETDRTEIDVCKVYQEGQTMLDLKSGFLNLIDFNTEELMVMFFAGIE